MSKGENELTDQEYWEHAVDCRLLQQLPPTDPGLERVLTCILPAKTGLRFLEIGCCPSKFMPMVHKKLGYHVSGLDFVDTLPEMDRLLRASGIGDFELFHADFFQFQPDNKFDVVGSFGFVEHFENTAEVVARHAALTEPGGYVVVEFPNFHYGQRLLQRAFYPARTKTHNTSLTKRGVEREMRDAGLEIVFSNYVRTFGLAVPPLRKGSFRYYTVELLTRALNLLNVMGLGNIPNRWFSPYVLIVGRRPT